MQRLILVLAFLVLGACASNGPPELGIPPHLRSTLSIIVNNSGFDNWVVRGHRNGRGFGRTLGRIRAATQDTFVVSRQEYADADLHISLSDSRAPRGLREYFIDDGIRVTEETDEVWVYVKENVRLSYLSKWTP